MVGQLLRLVEDEVRVVVDAGLVVHQAACPDHEISHQTERSRPVPALAGHVVPQLDHETSAGVESQAGYTLHNSETDLYTSALSSSLRLVSMAAAVLRNLWSEGWTPSDMTSLVLPVILS